MLVICCICNLQTELCPPGFAARSWYAHQGQKCVAGAAGANIEKVGNFAASGFIFKDNVEVVVIDDPEVGFFG
jgi:hypothetical protein